MRRLVLLVSAIVLVDTVFFAAITPLLPFYSDRLGLSKSAAGVLAAAYPAGTLLFSIPAGWVATRVGVRATVIGGLALMASASVVFGFADDAWLLGTARFLQGVGSAFTWAGGLAWLVGNSPVDRRAEAIGTAFGAAIGGALLGPVLGAAARAAGTEVVFSAVAVLNVVLGTIAARMPVERAGPAVGGVREALRDRRTLAGAAVVVLVGLFFGVLDVLVPLRLDELGAGGAAIGATFLVAGLVSAFASPLVGRWVDRRGPLKPLQLGLFAGAAFAAVLPWPTAAIALSALVVATAPAVDVLWVPGMTLLSEGTERRGVDQAYAFALVNLAWASSTLAGAAGGSALADATSDALPYLALTAAFLVALYSLSRSGSKRSSYSSG
jgi:MFS family permease